MDRRSTAAGETVFVSDRQGTRGSKGPFMVAYETREGNQRYGYFCANCERFDTAMDSMGRIQCNHCGNVRKPTEWDAAHE